MMKIVKSKTKCLIAEEIDHVHAEPAQTKVETQTEKSLFDMLQASSTAAYNRHKTTSARFLQTITIEIFSGGAADENMLEFFVPLEESNKFLNVFDQRTLCSQLLLK